MTRQLWYVDTADGENIYYEFNKLLGRLIFYFVHYIRFDYYQLIHYELRDSFESKPAIVTVDSLVSLSMKKMQRKLIPYECL